jgi:hypothetical protein
MTLFSTVHFMWLILLQAEPSGALISAMDAVTSAKLSRGALRDSDAAEEKGDDMALLNTECDAMLSL